MVGDDVPEWVQRGLELLGAGPLPEGDPGLLGTQAWQWRAVGAALADAGAGFGGLGAAAVAGMGAPGQGAVNSASLLARFAVEAAAGAVGQAEVLEGQRQAIVAAWVSIGWQVAIFLADVWQTLADPFSAWMVPVLIAEARVVVTRLLARYFDELADLLAVGLRGAAVGTVQALVPQLVSIALGVRQRIDWWNVVVGGLLGWQGGVLGTTLEKALPQVSGRAAQLVKAGLIGEVAGVWSGLESSALDGGDLLSALLAGAQSAFAGAMTAGTHPAGRRGHQDEPDHPVDWENLSPLNQSGWSAAARDGADQLADERATVPPPAVVEPGEAAPFEVAVPAEDDVTVDGAGVRSTPVDAPGFGAAPVAMASHLFDDTAGRAGAVDEVGVASQPGTRPLDVPGHAAAAAMAEPGSSVRRAVGDDGRPSPGESLLRENGVEVRLREDGRQEVFVDGARTRADQPPGLLARFRTQIEAVNVRAAKEGDEAAFAYAARIALEMRQHVDGFVVLSVEARRGAWRALYNFHREFNDQRPRRTPQFNGILDALWPLRRIGDEMNPHPRPATPVSRAEIQYRLGRLANAIDEWKSIKSQKFFRNGYRQYSVDVLDSAVRRLKDQMALLPDHEWSPSVEEPLPEYVRPPEYVASPRTEVGG